jgi:molybdopterin molybdotransferase
MVSVSEAEDIILSNLFKATAEAVDLNEAVGRVLAEPIVADRDFPPFTRVAMDGMAFEFNEWKNGKNEFVIESIQAAGEPQKKLVAAGNAVEVMTGSVLPSGADTVVRYEDLDIRDGKAKILIADIVKGQHLHLQGVDAKKNETLLEPGLVLSAAEIALIASVGKNKVKVFSFPKAAILSSGDELVAIDTVPLPHQIRRSNSYSLQAAMNKLGWKGKQFHVEDEKEKIAAALKDIISTHDILIISGGVSKGKFDFIPEALENTGVKKLFHQVNQRPGKPFWFGRSDDGKIVFALPGNPVSTYMCFYRFVLPWLWKSLRVEKEKQSVVLAKDFSFKPALTYFLQVSVKNESGKLMAYPQAGGGSGDFANLKNVNGFIELPDNKENFLAGEVYPFISFRE